MNAAEFARRLQSFGVQTIPYFLGIHEQPVFLNQGLFKKESYPVADHIARQGLYLPSGMALTEEQVNCVCNSIHKILSKC